MNTNLPINVTLATEVKTARDGDHFAVLVMDADTDEVLYKTSYYNEPEPPMRAALLWLYVKFGGHL